MSEKEDQKEITQKAMVNTGVAKSSLLGAGPGTSQSLHYGALVRIGDQALMGKVLTCKMRADL